MHAMVVYVVAVKVLSPLVRALPRPGAFGKGRRDEEISKLKARSELEIEGSACGISVDSR